MALSLNNVSLTVRGESYLDNIDVSFERGSFNVLLGRTLAGKTSLLRVIAGLDQPSLGRVSMDGVDVTGVAVQKRKISMVYQQFINYPNLTVFENIASPLRIAGEKAATIRTKVESVAEMLHIENLLKRKPLELSGGQQQRTAMARALVKDSDLILFDEPLVNLDYKLREELRYELRELFKSRNVVAIYATTEAHEALALGGVTTLMHQGRVVQSGPVNDVYNQPTNITAAELFSEPAINLLTGSLSRQTVTLDNGTSFPLLSSITLSDGQYRFGIRPHHMSLTANESDDIGLDLQVDVAEISGSETYLHMAADSLTQDDPQALVAQIPGVHHFHSDAPIRVYFSPANLYAFDQQGRTVMTPLKQTQRSTSSIGQKSESKQ